MSFIIFIKYDAVFCIKTPHSQMLLALKTLNISSENKGVFKERRVLDLLTIKIFLIIKLISSFISYSVFAKKMEINEICRTYICTLPTQKTASFAEFAFVEAYIKQKIVSYLILICLVKTANLVSCNNL